MNESHHIVSRFDEDLNKLRALVLQMGGMIEAQVSSAIDAYSTGEIASIKDIVETDRKINALEKTIDDECAHVIAMRQPAASDLRLVLGIGKIVTDLERAGDEVKKIAKSVSHIHENGYIPIQFGAGIRHLGEAALLQVRQTLDAFARHDVIQAAAVIRADKSVDAEFKSILRQLITHMMEDPRTITICLEIMSVARALERIGDHAKNISEQVIFVEEGRDVRHNKDKEQAE